jgi:ubiquinone/menaquinone biosynthesis C-methylase UbiE
MESARTYLPAAGHDWFLPLYDPIVKLLGGEAARKELLERAGLRPGDRVLDIGCGTGTLALQIKHLYPRVEIVGIDPDPKALARARHKAASSSVSVQFDQGFADELPYPERSFDHVFSSFMFHHLPAEERETTLREVRRVVKAGGEFHMLDFEGPEDRKHGWLANLFHSNKRLHDNSEERVLGLLKQAGFADAQKVGRRTMLFGGVAYYRAATNPGSSNDLNR